MAELNHGGCNRINVCAFEQLLRDYFREKQKLLCAQKAAEARAGRDNHEKFEPVMEFYANLCNKLLHAFPDKLFQNFFWHWSNFLILFHKTFLNRIDNFFHLPYPVHAQQIVT